MTLLSKLELVRHEVRYLVQDDIPSILAVVRLASGAEFDMYCLHPRPPRFLQESTQRDAELVLAGREVAKRRRPAVVAGDLNDVAWSHTTRLFRRLSRLLDPRIGRSLYTTFPARLPISWLRYPLDHVFHSDEFRLRHLRTLTAKGSDHRAVVAGLVYEPGGKGEQEAPRDDASDDSESREIVDEANSG